ncbi:hypothetical protein [Klebsiella quasipneumoniae]
MEYPALFVYVNSINPGKVVITPAAAILSNVLNASSDTVMLCAKTCDRCGRHAKTVVDDIEFNEFLSVNHLAGYGSIFGDSNRLKLDLCQHCLKDVLGQWITVCDQ